MAAERSPRDDLDVRLEWRDAGDRGTEPPDEPARKAAPARTAVGAKRRAGALAGPASADPTGSALLSLSSTVGELMQAVSEMQQVVESTAAKVDKLQKSRAQGDPAEFRDELAELARQVELLRKRVSLRARSEQLTAETAERIAAAVIDRLAEVGPEVGPRPRSRRRIPPP